MGICWYSSFFCQLRPGTCQVIAISRKWKYASLPAKRPAAKIATARTNCVRSDVDEDAGAARPTTGDPGTSAGVLTVSMVLRHNEIE